LTGDLIFKDTLGIRRNRQNNKNLQTNRVHLLEAHVLSRGSAPLSRGGGRGLATSAEDDGGEGGEAEDGGSAGDQSLAEGGHGC